MKINFAHISAQALTSVFGLVLLLLAGALVATLPASAQEAAPVQDETATAPPEGTVVQDPKSQEREILHLNTIGTYSAGFVLQSFGYIGVLADTLSQGVYTRDMVHSMLSETITYLNNANSQLQSYKSPGIEMSEADLQFLNGIQGIIVDLVKEAEALADFAANSQDEDLSRFHAARNKAWNGIKATLKVN